jgi:AcrR family transcriptional regulator
MGRKAGRTPEQTRRLALDAAATVFRTQGVGATLDDVARVAGLSKGGLVYHFKSKDELLRALVTDIIDAWREAVIAKLDPEDSAPGRLTRAYIRACLADDHDQHELRDAIALSVQLATDAQVAAAMNADAARWAADLQDDGLPGDVIRIIIAAADGASTLPEWSTGETEENAALCRHLIALSHAAEPFNRFLVDASR